MVAHSLNDRDRPTVSDGETLAYPTVDIQFSGRSAIEQCVAGNGIIFSLKSRVARRNHHYTTARKTLAEIVVGITLQLQRHSLAEERPETLSGRTRERQFHAVIGKTRAAESLGDVATEHRPRQSDRC